MPSPTLSLLFACAAIFVLSPETRATPQSETNKGPLQIDWTQFHWLTTAAAIENKARLSPVNFEGDIPQFVHRAKYKNNLIPGKFNFIDDGSIHARFGADGIEHEAGQNTEILHIPFGTVEWTPHRGAIPDRAVCVGSDPNVYQLTYICRATHTNNLSILGRMVGDECLVPYYGYEYTYATFDVLVLSELGLSQIKPKYVP